MFTLSHHSLYKLAKLFSHVCLVGTIIAILIAAIITFNNSDDRRAQTFDAYDGEGCFCPPVRGIYCGQYLSRNVSHSSECIINRIYSCSGPYLSKAVPIGDCKEYYETCENSAVGSGGDNLTFSATCNYALDLDGE